MDLNLIREKLNKIDDDILNLLAKRQVLIIKVGEFKKKNKLPINQPQREVEMFARLEGMSKEKSINPLLVKNVFKEIIKDSKKIQKKIV